MTNPVENPAGGENALLAEDLADLQATVAGLAQQVERQRALLEELAGGGARPAGAEGHTEDGRREEEPAVPPFLLTLAGMAYLTELAALSAWVADLLVPVYIREAGPQAPWCPRWWEHPEAEARLHALWLAWQELTDPDTGGRTGPSVWHRDHLDPALAMLRAPDGPFAGCMTHVDKPTHRLTAQPPVDRYELPPGDEPA